jgi:Lon-like ATP-dependent protease
MEGACVPWQNKRDIEPLLINMEYEYIQKEEIPGIRIYRSPERQDPFDIYFCKTKYNAYKVLMGLNAQEVEERMAERSRSDMAFYQKSGGAPLMAACGI